MQQNFITLHKTSIKKKKMTNSDQLAHALDTWNTNILMQGRIPPRSKKGLKAYTKQFGKQAKEFGLMDVAFTDAIAAFRSLPYSFPEFKHFAIPEKVQSLLQGIDYKTGAIAEILDYYIKDGKPQTIYPPSDPYWIEAQLMVSYRDTATELFTRSNRLKQLFPSVAVFWGCLLIGYVRFWLNDSGITSAMLGVGSPNILSKSKREITSEANDCAKNLQKKQKTTQKGEVEVGSDPFILFWQEALEKHRNKRFREENLTPLISRIRELSRTIERDRHCQYLGIASEENSTN